MRPPPIDAWPVSTFSGKVCDPLMVLMYALQFQSRLFKRDASRTMRINIIVYVERWRC